MTHFLARPGLRTPALWLLLTSIALLAGCAGGAGRLEVNSTPSDLTAYAIPSRVWYRTEAPLQDILDHPARFRKYKYGRLTKTEAKSLSQGTYFVVVTDGSHAEFIEKKVYPTAGSLSVTVELPE